ncbi:MAG TPA: methyltransferase domain-containing protein [Streptosporangiaceae bacterium]|jgi:ubiquinone/menaquinone biosynthesis C-methylase UbiE
MSEGFQLDGQGPHAYERYLVPAFFDPCAEMLLDLAAVQPGERVLDVACGTGIVARRAAGRVGGDGRVVGVDVNDGMIDVAGSITAQEPDDCTVEWRRADAGALPLPDGAFDVVACQQGLQFFSDVPGALGEMLRVLAPKGRLALGVWRDLGHHPAFGAMVRALDRHIGDEAAAIMRSPFAGPRRDELRRLLATSGYDKIEIRVGIVTVRFDSAREFLWEEVACTPLAEPVGAMDDRGRDAMVQDFEEMLWPFLDDDGVVFPMQTWLVTAGHRGS